MTDLSDPATTCDTSSGTANSINVYVNGGNYEFKQNESGTKSVRSLFTR